MPPSIKEKLYFGIYVDEKKKFHHLIVFRKSKKVLTDELRDKGFVPKGVFSEKDIEKVKSETFMDTNVSDKTLQYLKENLSDLDRIV